MRVGRKEKAVWFVDFFFFYISDSFAEFSLNGRKIIVYHECKFRVRGICASRHRDSSAHHTMAIYLRTCNSLNNCSLFLSLLPLFSPVRERSAQELITCYTLRRVENVSF